MFLKLRAMLIKELKTMLRDPKMRMVVFVFPMVQLLVMSFALTLDVKNINIAVYDMDRSQTSQELVSKMEASGYFHIQSYVGSPEEVHKMLDKGDVRGAVIIPANLEKDLNIGLGSEIQVIADGTMSNDAGIIFSYVSTLLNEFNSEMRYSSAGIRSTGVNVDSRVLYNPNLTSFFYYVPGLISLMIMVTSILLTSIAIVREKEIGTIEQVMVTPIGRFEFIVGKTLPFSITGYITTTIMFLIAYLIFDVVIKGSILLLGIVIGLNLMAYLGLALLISTTAYTQQQALLTAFFIMMPSALLSGFMFPISNMPEAVQYLTYLDPMRWGFESIIGIVAKGATAYELRVQIFWQVIHAAFFITVASLMFKKNIE